MDKSDENGFPGEYDPETDTYRIFYNEIADPVSTIIVEAVAALTDTPPTELDPLYNILNPDALNNLYHFDRQRGSGQSEDYLAFTYNDCRVKLFRTGTIEIETDPNLQ